MKTPTPASAESPASSRIGREDDRRVLDAEPAQRDDARRRRPDTAGHVLREHREHLRLERDAIRDPNPVGGEDAHPAQDEDEVVRSQDGHGDRRDRRGRHGAGAAPRRPRRPAPPSRERPGGARTPSARARRPHGAYAAREELRSRSPIALGYAPDEPVQASARKLGRRGDVDVPAGGGLGEETAEGRPARIREQHLVAEPRQQGEQLRRVARLVEDVGGEDEVERAARDELVGVSPADDAVSSAAPLARAFRSAYTSASGDQSVASTLAPPSAATMLGSARPQPSSTTARPSSARAPRPDGRARPSSARAPPSTAGTPRARTPPRRSARPDPEDA